MKKNYNFKNLLICDDNLKALDDLKKQSIKADLIYLDPPFFSNRHYEVVWGDEAEVRSFKDRWAGGIHVYIEWMKERVVKLHDILKDTGSFYFHCDWHASHYLKVMLDEVFGQKNLRNEIIWKRKGGSANPKNRFGIVTDSIFWYSKTKEIKFNPQYTLESEDVKNYINERFNNTDENGRRFMKSPIVSPNPRPNLTYKYKGYEPPKNGWSISQEIMEQWDKKGKLYFPPKGKGERIYRKIYLNEYIGQPIQNLWADIFVINPVAKERLGYPTQKPEALLERIIKSSSSQNDLILDPFCGCGTAMAVAQQLKRRWIGIDISPTAICLIEKRLEKIGAIKEKDFDSIGMPTTITALKKLEPFEFQNWVINEMQAKQSKRKVGDKGIDGHIGKSLYSEEAGIQVKQSEKVGRNVIDNFETALERKKYKKGYIVGFSFTKDAHEEAARVREEKGLYIKLIKTEDLLKRKSGLLK